MGPLLWAMAVLGAATPQPAGEVTLNLDFFDLVTVEKLWDLDRLDAAIERMCRRSAEAGVKRILYRVSVCGEVSYPSKVMTPFDGDPRRGEHGVGGTTCLCDRLKDCLDRWDPLALTVESGHRHGLEVWGWITLFDSYFPNLQDEFLDAHPAYWWASRDGKAFLRGVPCYACPEVVDYRLAEAREVLGYGVDGLYFSVRSHASWPSDAAWEYGYNAPVVEAFRERYGRDPRLAPADSLDVLRFVKLGGEFLTGFLRRAKALAGDRPVAINFAESDASPAKATRMFVDVDTLVREGIVAEACSLSGLDESEAARLKLLRDEPLKVSLWRNVWAWGATVTGDERQWYADRVAGYVDELYLSRWVDGVCLHEQLHFEVLDLYDKLGQCIAAARELAREPLPARFGFVDEDGNPATGALTFQTQGGCALDYRNRSVGLDLGEPRDVAELWLWAGPPSARVEAVTSDRLSVWVSDDNETYRQVEPGPEIEGRRLPSGAALVSLRGLRLRARYVKVHFVHEGDQFSFAARRAADLLRAYGPQAGR